MSRRAEHCLEIYFRLLALSCSARSRFGQILLNFYMVLAMAAGIFDLFTYLNGSDIWNLNETQQPHQLQFKFYVGIIEGVNVAYKVAHVLFILHSLFCRKQERRLLGQLPILGNSGPSLVHTEMYLAMECLLVGATVMQIFNYSNMGNEFYSQLFYNFHYILTTQAIRARYLQYAMLVSRLDSQLDLLAQQIREGSESIFQLRGTYARLAHVARSLSELYAPAMLIMNVLCVGDFIIVCYAYIMVWELEAFIFNWLLLWQTIHVLSATFIKLWTLCSVCQSCSTRSQQLLGLINKSRFSSSEMDNFALQIMQNAIEFDVYGIYQLHRKTFAAIFIFIFESLVILLQFVVLTKQQSS